MTSQSDLYKALPTFDATIEKWPSFYYKLRIFLKGKELLHIIDRPSDPPVLGETSDERSLREEQAQSRAKDDPKVMGILVNKLADQVLPLVMDLSTSFEMVERLKAQYQSNSAALALSRLNRLLDLEYKTTHEISSHFAGLNGVINEIRETGGLDLDKVNVVALLRSMPKTGDWAPVISALKAQDESTLTKEKVVRTLTETAAELKRKSSQPPSKGNGKPSAFVANTPFDRKQLQCHNCGKKGHMKKDCWAKGGGAHKPANLNNHPKGNHNNQKPGSNSGNFTFSVGNNEESSVWIKDSGASKHYTGSTKGMFDVRKVCQTLLIADGKKLNIEGVGSMTFLATTTKREKNLVTLNEVYYVSGLVANLLSTSELDRK